MNKEMVLDFSPEGSASGMHFDNFPLSFLGKMKVDRASEIVFNTETQSWDVEVYCASAPNSLNTDIAICDFPGYDIARKFEVEFVQMCRKTPNLTEDFRAFLAKEMRKDFLAGINHKEK